MEMDLKGVIVDLITIEKNETTMVGLSEIPHYFGFNRNIEHSTICLIAPSASGKVLVRALDQEQEIMVIMLQR